MSTRKRAFAAAAALTTAMATVAALSTPSLATTATRAPGVAAGNVRPVPNFAYAHDVATLPTPLPTSQCLTQLGIRCYSPLQYRSAYDFEPLYKAGITGAGRTIVIVDSFGSPTIQHDLDVFDAQYGLPATTVDVRQFGAIPPFDPTDSTRLGWAGETTLDVEYAHAIAPGAKIVLVETAVAETQGVQGFPEMMDAEKSLIDAGVGDVISQSFGSTENNFPGFAQGDFRSLTNLRYAFQDAAKHNVTVLASSGDNGVADSDLSGNPYPTPVNSWPSSDPLVTSIGGTYPTIDDTGKKTAPDVAGNDDEQLFPGGVVAGGGLSHIFKRPSYQAGVKSVVGDHRGTPDISFSAVLSGAAWFYYSYQPSRVGWHLVAGTSESCPIMAGVVALADQVAGHRLGNIDHALYTLGHLSTLPNFPHVTGIVDVTSGSISAHGVTGPSAGPGYDSASGWGTIDAAYFVPALALTP
jgi:subtilase family serine protease